MRLYFVQVQCFLFTLIRLDRGHKNTHLKLEWSEVPLLPLAIPNALT